MVLLVKFNAMNWEYFVEEPYHRFGEPSRKDFIEEFNKLFQTDIALNYQEQFEHLCSPVDADKPTL